MKIYVDGSCSNNGKKNNRGGFGVAIFTNDHKLIDTYSKECKNTTNNREELKAIIYVLLKYGQNKNDIPIVYSDSSYAVNTLTNWMFSWASNDWKKFDKKTPENLDLIKTYYKFYCKGYRIKLIKIKGHSGCYGNDLADKLATQRKEENING